MLLVKFNQDGGFGSYVVTTPITQIKYGFLIRGHLGTPYFTLALKLFFLFYRLCFNGRRFNLINEGFFF
jgi:hypothetical protein